MWICICLAGFLSRLYEIIVVMCLAESLTYRRYSISASALSLSLLERTHSYKDIQRNRHSSSSEGTSQTEVTQSGRGAQEVLDHSHQNYCGGAHPIQPRFPRSPAPETKRKYTLAILWIQEKDVSKVFLSGFFLERGTAAFPKFLHSLKRPDKPTTKMTMFLKIFR